MKKKLITLLTLAFILGTFAPFQPSHSYAATATNENSAIEDTITDEEINSDLDDMDPALAAETVIVMDYITQLEALSDYEDKAVTTYNKNRYVTTKNRKTIYSALNNTVIPNYTKFVIGLKKIKPDNEELAAIHGQYIKAASLQLQAMTLFKKYAGDPKLNVKTLNLANKKVSEGMKMLDRYKKSFEKYAVKFQ